MNTLQAAMLLAHAINTIGAQSGDEHLDYCCWHECAPCSVIHELLSAGELTAAVRPFVVSSGGGYDWWTGSPEHGLIKLSWFLARLCSSTACPNIEHDD